MLAVTPSPVPDRGPLSPRRSLGILTPNPSLPPVSPPTPKLTTCRPGPRSLCRVVPRPPGCQPTSCPSVSAVPVAQLRPGPPPASTGPVSGSSGDPGPGSFTSGLLVPHPRRGRGAGRGQSGVWGGEAFLSHGAALSKSPRQGRGPRRRACWPRAAARGQTRALLSCLTVPPGHPGGGSLEGRPPRGSCARPSSSSQATRQRQWRARDSRGVHERWRLRGL